VRECESCMNDYVLSAQENLTLVIKSQKYSLFP
jgi:hypothetical protein